MGFFPVIPVFLVVMVVLVYAGLTMLPALFTGIFCASRMRRVGPRYGAGMGAGLGAGSLILVTALAIFTSGPLPGVALGGGFLLVVLSVLVTWWLCWKRNRRMPGTEGGITRWFARHLLWR